MVPPTALGMDKWSSSALPMPFSILALYSGGDNDSRLQVMEYWAKNMNETKVEILKCLSDGQWWTTPAVAYACSLSLTNVSELLRRYRSQSLVNRVRNYSVPRGYYYRITNTGLARLQYLRSDVLETSSVIASHVGLRGTKKRELDRWVKQKLRR